MYALRRLIVLLVLLAIAGCDRKSASGPPDRKAEKSKEAPREAAVQEPRTLEGSESNVQSIAISPDGKRLASAAGFVVTLWDLKSAEAVLTITVRSRAESSPIFSPDGTLLATHDGDAVHIRDSETGRELQSIKTLSRTAALFAFAEGGRRLVLSQSILYEVIDVEAGTVLRRIEGAADANGGVGANAAILATAPRDGRMKIFDLETGDERGGFTAAAGRVTLSPDGKLLAVGRFTSIELWDVARGALLRELSPSEPGQSFPGRAFFTSDGKTLAAGTAKESVLFFDVATGRQTKSVQTPGLKLSYVVSADGKLIAWPAGPRIKLQRCD